MNLQIPYSWLTDFLETKADIKTIVKSLNETGPTVEKVIQTNNDYLLDIEVTINRPDCLGVLGIAREIYTSLRQKGIEVKLKNDFLTNWPKLNLPKNKIPLNFQVNSKLTRRFTAVLFKNVIIKPSENLIKQRLEITGIRSLNNVIDLTNYLMLESGQPNHAFDFDKISGPNFIVRPAKKGEKIITLDNQSRVLADGDIVIEDSRHQIIDLCGIMGGQKSAIDSSTTSILLLVANDYYAQIRKTSMRLGIQTEASARLSKVLDQEITYPVILRAIELFKKYCQAQVTSEIVDLYPKKQIRKEIPLTDQFLEEKIGLCIEPKTTDRILTDLGFKVQRFKGSIKASPPIWRLNDVQLPIDVVEEITRIIGYDQIPNQPLLFELPPKAANFQKKFSIENQIRNLLIDWGFYETVSYSMLPENETTGLKISNPLSEDWVIMQPTLIPNLINNFQQNLVNFPNLRLFEIANVFNKKSEQRNLIFGIHKAKFREIKGIIEGILEKLKVKNLDWQSNKDQSVQIIAPNKKNIGLIDQVKEIYFCEINLDLLILQVTDQQPTYKPQSPYTPIIEDLTLVIPNEVKYQRVYNLINQTENIDRVIFLEAYQNRFSFRLHYQLAFRQITNTDAKSIREKLLTILEQKTGATLH